MKIICKTIKIQKLYGITIFELLFLGLLLTYYQQNILCFAYYTKEKKLIGHFDILWRKQAAKFKKKQGMQ